jgi:hypothetical protein
MAFADNLTLITDEEESYNELMRLVADYQKASNGKVNQDKSGAVFPAPKGRRHKTGHWHNSITYKEIPNDEEWVELGCPLRPDGQVPVINLQKFLNTIRWRTIPWMKTDMSMVGRIHATNTYILSKLWHATQICPLLRDYHSQIARIIKPMLFRSTRSPINFKLICMPKSQGGLGLIQPEHMMQAMNGKVIAILCKGTTHPN